ARRLPTRARVTVDERQLAARVEAREADVPLEQLALHELGGEVRAAEGTAAGDEHGAAGAEAVEAEYRLAPHDWLVWTVAGLELPAELWSSEVQLELQELLSSLDVAELLSLELVELLVAAADDDALVVVFLDRAGSWPWTICT